MSAGASVLDRPSRPGAAPDRVVSVRAIPYPYRSLLAICSDLDETPDRTVYWESTRFLNTTGMTAMGPGVGLEVGNTIYFDMPADQFAYWTTDDRGRAMLHALMRSGHVDCLHSFGDFADTRAHAGRALDELARHDCRLQVWIDHAVAPTNFGADIMRGSGDVEGAAAYHADLTWGYGIRHVWRGRVTSAIGQDAPRSLAGIFDERAPLRSARTLATELAKGWLARAGSPKYGMHAGNALMRPSTLRSGQPVQEFLRFNPSSGGVSCDDTSAGLGRVLTDAMVRRLADTGGVGILYTHLGKIADPRQPFGAATCDALRRLRQHQDEGRVLVTTTRRLLGYCAARRDVSLQTAQDQVGLRLDLAIADDRVADLQGWTAYVAEPAGTTVRVNGRPVPLQINPPDETGAGSVTIPWNRLEFPSV